MTDTNFGTRGRNWRLVGAVVGAPYRSCAPGRRHNVNEGDTRCLCGAFSAEQVLMSDWSEWQAALLNEHAPEIARMEGEGGAAPDSWEIEGR